MLVSVAYLVAEGDRSAFRATIRAFRSERIRNVALDGALYKDAAAPGRFVKTFLEPSWQGHLRHHGRVTKADSALQETVLRLHKGPIAR